MAKKQKINPRSVTRKIVAINARISSNKITLTEKRQGEKEIRDLKRSIGKKTNEFYPSEIKRLKSERTYLSQKKSRLNKKLKSGEAKNKREVQKTELEILRLAKRQLQVSKYIDPEKYDMRRRENKEKAKAEVSGFKRDRTVWIPDIPYIPIYQVKSEMLDKYSKSKRVKKVLLNGKTFRKNEWAELYIEWQSFYRSILNSATDLRSGKLKDSNIFFSSFRNQNGSFIKIVFDGFEN